MEAQVAQKDTKEEDVFEEGVQPSTTVQTSTKMQPGAMEIDMSALGATEVKRCITIMDKTIILDKGICILDLDRFMWIQMKWKYDKHVERMENWKDINEEEKWASKARLVTLFFMDLEASMPKIMQEFLNTFVIKGINIYFGYQDKVYVINKQLIINVFKVYVEGYVEDSKGQVNKTIAL